MSGKPDSRVPPPLASHPLSTILVAPRRSGKSALICGLINEIYAPIFDKVIIMSDTVQFDKSIQELSKITKHKNIYFTDEVNNSSIGNIVERQKSEMGKEKILLFIDDSADGARSKDLSRELDKLFTKGRQFNLSIIVCCQAIRSQLSSKQKNCSTEWIVFKNNAEDLKILAKVLTTAFAEEKQVLQYLTECTKEKYAFCYVNLMGASADEIYKYCDSTGFHDYTF
ncbi:hypothetical protein DFS34DRAFT_671729 [Phlyctochytrium arcticum]|nr:hypothetical protein DFS34DRAFT_665679 [Phlyctochytrium arcticum]KAI9103350.1 hypothetical protein DFS34DRAFT_671729 [Phlyctochytrium arcticum]